MRLLKTMKLLPVSAPRVGLVVASVFLAASVAAQNIVNGATTSAWETVASVETGDGGTCSATLVGCSTILTAAHCVCEPGGTTGECPDGTFILDPFDYTVFIPHAGEFLVSDVAITPDYDFGARGDVAVLTLENPVRSVAPAPINDAGSPDFGTNATIVGFGTLAEGGDDSQVKREADVVTATCQDSGAPDAFHVCWSDPAGTTCDGDSGGAMFVDLGDGIVLAGIHSGGSPVCTPGSPAFDTDLFANRDFLADAAGADLSFAACGDGPQVGDAGVVNDNFSAVLPAGANADHQVEVAEGVKLLRVALNADVGSDPTNDLDIFVRFGAAATPEAFDCGPQFPNSMEVCEFPDPQAGTWFINVDTFAGGPSEYQLTVVQLPPNPAPPSFNEGDVVIADFLSWEIFHVDANGDRSILSSTLAGSGSELESPEGVLLSEDEEAVYVANLGQLSVLSVDLDTGDRSVVSGCSEIGAGACAGAVVGSGLDLFGPRFITHDNGDLLITDRSDPGIAAVVRIDIATGNRDTVSGCTNSACGSSRGSGPAFDSPVGIGVLANGDIVVADTFGLVSVDPATGDRTLISGDGVGEGPDFTRPGQLAVDGLDNVIVVDGDAGLLRVNPVTGLRAEISGPTRGDGPAITDLAFGVGLLDGGDYLVADGGLQALVEVDGLTGDRTVVSGCADETCSALVGAGTEFTDPVAVAFVQPMPEPATALGIAAGSGLLAALARRRHPRA